MKIIGLTDIHGHFPIIELFSEVISTADLIVLSGDITNFGMKKEMEQVIGEITKYNPNVLGVLGNCDFPEAGKVLSEAGISIDCRNVEFQGYNFIGAGGSLPCSGHTPNEMSEELFETVLTETAKKTNPSLPLILVVHHPPVNTLNDKVGAGNHAGSKSIRKFIEKHQPLLCFSGHIHEGAGVDTIGKTKIINPGPLFLGGYAEIILEDTEIKECKIDKVSGKGK